MTGPGAPRTGGRARTSGVTPADGRTGVGGNVVRVGLGLALAFALIAAGAGYWGVYRATELASAPDDPAVVAASRNVARGLIHDRDGTVLADNERDANGEPYRVYVDDTVSQVVGYASRQFGTAGLERTFDAALTGIVRADPVDDLVKKFSRRPGDPQDLQLSLSLDLQRLAIRELGNDRGAVVMLDPTTGEVLALASNPTYDASAVANPKTSTAAFEALREDDARPLLPRATQGQYVPGSVLKVVTAIAALGSGAVTPETTYREQPEAEKTGLLVDGFRIRDGHHPQTGGRHLDFVEATQVSCNIWYALAGLDAGPGALDLYADRLGFGDPVPFDLPVARSQLTNGGGDLPGGFKDDVEVANAAYGQGETLATPLEMALVAATVANDGVLMRPRLVTSIGDRASSRTIGPEAIGRVVDGAVAREIQVAMQAAVESDLGRQFTSGAKVPGVPTAGKSGTAELGGSGEPHSWFIGFAPVDDPQVAIAVLVERGGRGGERAAPLAGRMMRAFFEQAR